MSCASPCCVYQLLGHLLDLCDEVGEELGHVLLLAGVQRLFVHGVGLTEGPRVVGLPLALLSRNNNNNTDRNVAATNHRAGTNELSL